MRKSIFADLLFSVLSSPALNWNLSIEIFSRLSKQNLSHKENRKKSVRTKSENVTNSTDNDDIYYHY
jgi:hypothetical protein